MQNNLAEPRDCRQNQRTHCEASKRIRTKINKREERSKIENKKEKDYL